MLVFMANDNAAPALMKDLLGSQALITIADAGQAASPQFDRAAFLEAALAGLPELSIMERVRHIADALKIALPVDYRAALSIIQAMMPQLKPGFQAIAVTEFVARNGLNDFDLSMRALTNLTRFGSAEFAIRPFIEQNCARALDFMVQWSDHDNEHVRRLASEGSRPRLPWASRVSALKKDPCQAITILEKLKNDPSLYVRKSVANHLNDISKDEPDWLLTRLEAWPVESVHTNWIIRHALRTLIKKGEPRALSLIGVRAKTDVAVQNFDIAPPVVTLGEKITLSATVLSTAMTDQRLVVDYRLHYCRAGGKTAAKVFKLRTFELGAGQVVDLTLQQMIRDFSTRRHNAGVHRVDLIINGQTMAQSAFEIVFLPDNNLINATSQSAD